MPANMHIPDTRKKTHRRRAREVYAEYNVSEEDRGFIEAIYKLQGLMTLVLWLVVISVLVIACVG